MRRSSASHKSDNERRLLSIRAKVQTALDALNDEDLELDVARSELEAAEKVLRNLELNFNDARKAKASEKIDSSMETQEEIQQDTTRWILDNFTEHDVAVAHRNHEIHVSKIRSSKRRTRSIQECSEDAHKALSLPPVSQVLKQTGEFDFDALALAEALGGTEDMPICVFGAHVVQYRGHMIKAMEQREWISNQETFSQAFLSFLDKIDLLYKQDASYHNGSHAADVMATTDVFMRAPYILDRTTTLDHFMSLTAAAVHDAGHTGRNALFHMKTMSPLAIRYNDKSILENMHASLAFQTMKENPETNWLGLLASDADDSGGGNLQQYVRKGIISMVLATDMVKHQKYVTQMTQMAEEAKHKEEDEEEEDVPETPAVKQQALQDKLFLLEAVLHAADLSNPCKPRHIALAWCRRICEEFWAQGDEERSLNLPISPMCDRVGGMATVPKSQLGFINFVIKPLFTPLAELALDIKEATDELEKNSAFWVEQEKKGATFVQLFGESSEIQGSTFKPLFTTTTPIC